jgi:K+-sensing histidine kinase KdpD
MRFRGHSSRLLSLLDTAIGTLLCASVALVLALVFNQTRLEFALPLICLAVVLAVAARFGVATGVLGSIVSAFLFAYFVYSPEGSFHIASPDARANVSWLLLGGISLSFLFTPRRENPEPQQEHHQQEQVR